MDTEALRRRNQLTTEVLFLVVIALAATLRVIALGRIPPGLYHDEARNGLDALGVLSGHWPVYFAANRGREPLFIYLSTVPLGLLGRTPAALRLAAAIIGTLTIPATVLWARSWFGQRVGLLSGAVLGVMLWHVHLSRVAFRAVTLPLLVALALWLGTRAWRSRRRGLWLLAGLLYGACFYTYLAVRFTPFVLAAWAGVLALRKRLKQLWPGAAWFGLGAGVALVPLAAYAAGHWDVVMGRPGAVSVFNPLINRGDLAGTLLRHLGRTLEMFFVQGDTIPRHNLPGRPVFDPVLGLMMLVGVAWAIAQARGRLAPALLLVWVGVMLMPTWLAEDAPHFLRAVGVLPLLAVLPGLGIEGLWRWLERRGRATWGIACALLVLMIGLGSTTYDYFIRYPGQEEARYFFEEAATSLAADVNDFLGSGWPGEGWAVQAQDPPLGRQAFVEWRLWEEWTAVPFLISAEGAVSTQPADLSPAGEATLLILWPYGEYERRLELMPYPARIQVWQGPSARGDLDPAPFTAYVAFAAEPVTERGIQPLARFERGIHLVEATARSRNGTWQLELVWEATSQVDADYTVFVHLLDGTTTVAQADGDPAEGYYPTSMWRIGDQVVDLHTLVPPGEPSEEPNLRVGLYLRSTLERLAVVDADGRPVDDGVSLPVPPAAGHGNH
ncbi:MAG: glycosyltransferase family 39 protein [Anaerolineae bacterium]